MARPPKSLRPTEVPGLYAVYYGGKRDPKRSYETEAGERVTRYGFQREKQAWIERQQERAEERAREEERRAIDNAIEHFGLSPADPVIRDLFQMTFDFREGRISGDLLYRMVRDWFDAYGEEYPDLDFDDIYALITGR